MKNTKTLRLPTVRERYVFHVGDLSAPPERRDSSYEGTGVSVSLCPEEWCSIAQIGGDLWKLARKDGRPARFVDYHRLGNDRRARLAQFAVEAGLLVERTAWRVPHYDEEGDLRYFIFDNEEDAQAEAEGWIDDEDEEAAVHRPEVIRAMAPTRKLVRQWSKRFDGELDLALAEEVGILTWLESNTDYDGMWWHDRMDPLALSAPRGVIFQARLAHFDARVIPWEKMHRRYSPGY